MTTLMRRTILAAAFAAALGGAAALPAHAKIRIALGNTPDVDMIMTLAAIERARERGLDAELIVLHHPHLAVEAVVSGKADVGIGAPYALIHDADVEIRFFVQISKLRYFPIVNAEFYRSWDDLDGQEVFVQAEGSGTEAVMLFMAKKHAIAYSAVRYMHGSEARRDALLEGTIKASIVDATNRDAVLAEAPDRFLVLQVDDHNASDEALFATPQYIEANAADVDILVEEIITTVREIAANPAVAIDLNNKFNLLPDLGPEADAAIEAYYTEHAGDGGLSLNGGGAQAAADDLAFFTVVGHIDGHPTTLEATDFWVLAPVDRAIAKLGRQ